MKKRVKRILGVRTLVLALSIVIGCDETESAQQLAVHVQIDRPRVVVLISLDTVRADHLGLYGYERFTSPVLDQLALQGVVFEDASTASPWTLPSHASILTGLYPAAHGVTSMKTRLPEEVPTLASALAEAGFVTAAVVNSTWLDRKTFGLTRDFAKYLFVPEVAERRAPNTRVTDQAIEWLREAQQDPEEELFLFVHYYDVHSDYASEPAYEKLFARPYEGIADGTTWQLTRSNLDADYLEMCHENFVPEKCTFGSVAKPWRVDRSVSKLEFDAADVAHLVDLYDAGIRQLDTELGRLFAWLRTSGLADQTLLIVTADHGEEFMEHGRLDHFLPTWQEVLHVPLIVRGPGIPAGVRIDAPVSTVDLAPTILSLSGATPTRPLDGLDLGGLWQSEAQAAPEFRERLLFGEASGGLTYDLIVRGFFPVFRSVRQGRYKLIHESKRDSYDLYDLNADPHEQHDVSEAHPEIFARLSSAMHRRSQLGVDDLHTDEVELSEEAILRLRELGYIR